MPVQTCTKNGKAGHQWGSSGPCYTGSDSKSRAARQGRAEKASENSSRSGAYRGVGEEAVKNRKRLKGMLKEAGQ